MKISIKGYYRPTPKVIRQIADAIYTATTLYGTTSVVMQHTWLGITIVIIGFICKAFSNFYVSSNDHTTTDKH
jgi:hypothetical protein